MLPPASNFRLLAELACLNRRNVHRLCDQCLLAFSIDVGYHTAVDSLIALDVLNVVGILTAVDILGVVAALTVESLIINQTVLVYLSACMRERACMQACVSRHLSDTPPMSLFPISLYSSISKHAMSLSLSLCV